MTIAEMTKQEMMQDAIQEAGEIMKGGICDVSMCRECNDNGAIFEADTVTVSSQNYFQFCNICCRFQETPYLVEVTVDSVVDCDICDCIDKFGSIRHNDGGYYHQTVYKVSKCEVLI